MTSYETVRLSQDDKIVIVAEQRRWKIVCIDVNPDGKIEFQCDQGHKIDMFPHDFLNGAGCRVCVGRTPEAAALRLQKIVDDNNAQLIVPYRGCHEQVTIKCAYGHTFSSAATNIVSQGTWCKLCTDSSSEHTPIRTSATINQEILEMATRRGWKVLTPYVKQRSRMNFECNQGHIIDVFPNNFMTGRGCGICAGQTPDAAAQRLQHIIDNRRAELITPYTGAFARITIRCAEGHTFATTATNVKRGGWCDMCKQRGNKYTGVEINDIITVRNGVLISEYVNRRVKITFKCDQDHVVSVWPHSILTGGWCTVCAETDPVTAEKGFLKKVDEMGGTVLGKYVNAYTNVEILCDNGHIFHMQPSSVKHRGQWCSQCSRSGGEKFIEQVIRDMKYEPELEFKLLKTSKYSFDFKFEHRGTNVLIEVDGNQHFKYIPHIHKTYQRCVRARYLDLFKTHKAIELGYKVIRIDYSWMSKPSEAVRNLIIQALDTNGPLYVSDLSKYDWIVIQPEDFIASLKGTELEIEPTTL